MHYHFNYPFNPWGAGETHCVFEGTDGTWYGYESGVFGSMSPDVTVEGQIVYEFKWNAAGDFVMSFGAAGDDLVTDTDIILFSYVDEYTVALTWDSDIGVLSYTGSELALATLLIGNYEADKKECFTIQILPNKFISLNFNLQRGTN